MKKYSFNLRSSPCVFGKNTYRQTHEIFQISPFITGVMQMIEIQLLAEINVLTVYHRFPANSIRQLQT